jgi:hypothetical protein
MVIVVDDQWWHQKVSDQLKIGRMESEIKEPRYVLLLSI